MSAYEIIRATMNEFAGVDDDTVNVYIALAEQLISERKFGKLYQQALACLAAHRMKLDGYGTSMFGSGDSALAVANSIGISSVSEGGSSVSFSNSQSTNTEADAEYGLTIYGMRFLQLRRSCIVRVASKGIKRC